MRHDTPLCMSHKASLYMGHSGMVPQGIHAVHLGYTKMSADTRACAVRGAYTVYIVRGR